MPINSKPPKWCINIIDSSFDINPKTGIIVCIKNISKQKKKGDSIGGSTGDGYLKVVLRCKGKSKHIRLHNMAWYLYYGMWPEHIIDHKNGNGTDNRKKNLRKCTDNQNCQNRKIIHNQLGHRGIRIIKRYNKDDSVRLYYQARIYYNNKRIDLGTFKDIDKAIDARLQGENKYYKQFAMCNRNKRKKLCVFKRKTNAA